MTASTIDHGRTATHDVTGKVIWFVHSISVRDDRPSVKARLHREGYRFDHGWRDASGDQWWTISRTEFA